ncbi:MAG TPA: Kdo hydroxylase family protein, partial [Acidobacteriaceae bacterium]|nr:Kdo hydroxylase family protein [Acidobacteriaceae bacterium]
MPVISISLDELGAAMGDRARLSEWCAGLEAGGVLYFPETPLPIAPDDLAFLLERKQTESGLHKNIAYKPEMDKLTGVDEGSASKEGLARLHGIMRWYSRTVEEFLGRFLAPYERRWVLDYASYRQIEEKNRELPLRKRNNLLHTDAFPTRPTYGRRILRFFHNINPTETRDWVIGEPFPRVVGHFAPGKLAVPKPDGALGKAGKGLAQAVGLAGLVPQLKRSP